MLCLDKKLTGKTVKIRFYRYDTNSGWGDKGTVLYVNIPVSAFDVSEDTNLDDSINYWYSLKDKWVDFFAVFFDSNSWRSGIDYEIADKNKRIKEMEELKEQIAKAEATIDRIKLTFTLNEKFKLC